MIEVQFARSGDALTGKVTLPEGLSGVSSGRGESRSYMRERFGSIRACGDIVLY